MPTTAVETAAAPSFDAQVAEQRRLLDACFAEVGKRIVGQQAMVRGMMMLRVPTTTDRSALYAALDRVEVMTRGDAIGMGVAVALLHLQDSAATMADGGAEPGCLQLLRGRQPAPVPALPAANSDGGY